MPDVHFSENQSPDINEWQKNLKRKDHTKPVWESDAGNNAQRAIGQSEREEKNLTQKIRSWHTWIKSMSYVVALTGGIGSGKSTVASAFAKQGIDIIDADIIARRIVAPGQPALEMIAKQFGQCALLPNGTLNRAWLRQKIFSSPNDKAWLNALLHPLIHAETRSQLDRVQSPWCLWVVPLLFENHLQNQANRVLVVDVTPLLQLQRTMARDNINREQAENIIASQVSRKTRLSMADDIIDNSGSPEEMQPHVIQLNQRYLALSLAVKQD